MSRKSSAGIVARARNRAVPPPPKLSCRIAKTVGWRGPTADEPPPPDAFARLNPTPMAFASIVANLAHPLLGADGHSREEVNQ